MTVNYRITATFTAWPATTAVQYLTITLNNVCMTTSFTSLSTQNSFYYQDGSNSADTTSATAFTYTLGALTATECNLTSLLKYKDVISDAWTATQPGYVLSPSTTTLAFSVKTATTTIADSKKDGIASRWV